MLAVSSEHVSFPRDVSPWNAVGFKILLFVYPLHFPKKTCCIPLVRLDRSCVIVSRLICLRLSSLVRSPVKRVRSVASTFSMYRQRCYHLNLMDPEALACPL